jgi:hypothetical protein
MLEFLERMNRLERRLEKNLPPKKISSGSSKLERFAARYKDDASGFTKLLQIDARRGRIPFELNEIQKRYHEKRTPRDVVLKARRVGMTTEAIARDVHHWLTKPSAAVGIVCQSGREHLGAEAVRRILNPFVDGLIERGLPLRFRTRSVFRLELEDGRSIDIIEAGASQAAASKTGRAGRFTRLHCTEMAYWEYAGETMNALRYCVAGPEFGTEVQIESTAQGSAGEDRDSQKEASGASMFHWAVQDAQRGDSGYRLHFFPWFLDPENRAPVGPHEVIEPRNARERQLITLGVTPEQLRWYQKQLDEVKSQDQVDQELASDPDTCFLVSGRTFFDKARTAELLTLVREPIASHHVRESGAYGSIVGGTETPAIRIWHQADAKRRYVVSGDTAEGDGGDAGAGIVLERGTGRHMATLWGQFKPWELAKYAVVLARVYHNALIAVERNKDGGTVLRALEAEQHYDNVFSDADGKRGWLTTAPSRAEMLATFEKAHRDKSFATFDRFIVSQIRTFIINSKGKPEAARGAHDDLVMATGIGWDVICRRETTNRDLTQLPNY